MKYIVLVGKGGRVEIAELCTFDTCKRYHFVTSVEDERVADTIVKALNSVENARFTDNID